jgi:hypothetical protein
MATSMATLIGLGDRFRIGLRDHILIGCYGLSGCKIAFSGLITKKCSSLKGQGIGLKGQVLIGLRGRIRGLGDRIWNGLEDLGLVGEFRAW